MGGARLVEPALERVLVDPADDDDAGRRGEVDAERAARAASSCASSPPLEQVLEHGRADRARLAALGGRQPRRGGQQRGGRLRDRLGQPVRERRPARGDDQPLDAARPSAARTGRGDGVPAVDVELVQRGRALVDRAPQQLGRRVAGGQLDGARGGEDEHAGVEQLGQARDDRLPGVRLAQRVDEVELHARQALVRAQVARQQRAVDRGDDLAERRAQRDREDRERALPRLVEQRAPGCA